LASHYTFEPLFCLPARGQEKPDAEKLVYTLERRWATPVPRAKDLAELNAYLLRCCLEERDRTPAGWSETIGQRFEQEHLAAYPLPPHPFDPCVYRPAQVDKYQTVRFDHNRYSVPRSFAYSSHRRRNSCIAVCRCLRGASRSAVRISSMRALKGSNTQATDGFVRV
jgi:hypothetical protein